MSKLSFWNTIFFLCAFCAVEAIASLAQAFTTLHSFDSVDGNGPAAALVQGTDGNLYGTTQSGGAKGLGTVFKISPAGTLTTLHSFDNTDGDSPSALIQATNGSLYGTTYGGGANSCVVGGTNFGCGTVFKITPSNGTICGSTPCGNVFKITPSGTLTPLYSFCSQSGCTDGAIPLGALVQGTGRNFYGTTGGGGANGNYGTVFKITPSGALTTLHSFDGTDGDFLVSGLIQATDGNFYGTTVYGGANGDGTIFKITPSGTLTTLHSFDSTDGEYPYAGLVQDTNGTLYGTTYEGGASVAGTVFSLSVGLGPFVETQTTSGKVGAAVKILGTNLTGATSVTFNGTAAAFKVLSSSEITTTVPAGATTGKVKVKTPHGTLTSNVNFRVTP